MYSTPAKAMAAGLPAQFGKLHLDHQIPVVLGGVDGPVRLLHATCNLRRTGVLGAITTNAARGYPVGTGRRWRRRNAAMPTRTVTRYDRW
jgi:hypothetical protein